MCSIDDNIIILYHYVNTLILLLQTLQTSKSAEDSLQKELQQVRSKLEEEIAVHKSDNSANVGQIAELEGTVREEREKREKLEQARERETTQLKEDVSRLSKELSDNRVSVCACTLCTYKVYFLKCGKCLAANCVGKCKSRGGGQPHINGRESQCQGWQVNSRTPPLPP